MTKIAAVFHFDVEARRIAEFANRRRHQREDLRVADLREILHRGLRDALRAVGATAAIRPVLQVHKDQPRVLARARKTEARDGKDSIDIVF